MPYYRTLHTIFTLALAALLAGCSAEKIYTPDEDRGYGNIALTFTNSRMGSRATTPDVDALNENLMSELLIALYPHGASEDEAPVIVTTVAPAAHTQTTVNLSLSKSQTDQLFAAGGGSATTGATCRMAVVANLPASATVPANPTIAQLRAIAVEADFKPATDEERVQPSFVMYGTGTVTYTEGDFGGTGAGEATLYRAAARISLNLRVAPSVESTDPDGTKVTWTPVTDNMRVLLSNGVSRSIVDPSAAAIAPAEADYFNIAAPDAIYGFTLRADVDATTGFPWQMDVPFYTYPNTWQNTITEDHRTYMTLMIPWKKGNETQYQWCYYQVPVTATTQVSRNYAYQVNLNVAMLGSFTPDEPTEEIEASYITVPWEEVEIPVNITDTRYLVVNQNNFVIDNAPSITIPFYTSHPVVVSSITLTYNRYNMLGRRSGGTWYGDGRVFPIEVDETQNNLTESRGGVKIYDYELSRDASGTNVIKVNHPLLLWSPRTSNGSAVAETGYTSEAAVNSAINSIAYYTKADGNAYSPYTINVTIKHSDMPDGSAFEQKLTIVQYPGMWIEADRNPYAGDGDSPNTGPGNVWVNGYQNNRGGLGNVNGISSNANNRNPNMYVVTINTLDASQSKYVIGDPRYLYSNNLNTSPNSDLTARTSNDNAASQSWCNSGRALYPQNTNSRRLTYYYPTNESDEYANVIAPKIRIASSYGVVNDIERGTARRRCAAYQEAGCPAGRWRLPTVGEMEFIVNLSSTGKIPTLLNNGTEYLSAQGWVTVSTGTLTASDNGWTKSAVRCVYDEWYWENLTDYTISPNGNGRYTFTWGDMPKGNPEGGH